MDEPLFLEPLPDLMSRLGAERRVRDVDDLTLEAVVADLLDDLSDLLNTRRTSLGRTDPDDPADGTLIHYGLPEVSHLVARNPEHWARLQAETEEAIRRYEPRLRNVTVETRDTGGMDNALAFRIWGELAMGGDWLTVCMESSPNVQPERVRPALGEEED